MASEIERNEDLFYVEGDGTPWHGLGIPVVGALTADEAIVKAGQNWTVETHPAYAKIGDNFVRIPDTFSTVRMDTKSPFPGTVGGVYVPFQNRDAFAFFDEVVGNNQAKYVTAGCLRGGQRVWILAQVGKNFKIADSKDEMAKYVLLYNAHDGSSKVRMMLTPIRVVCANTCNAALAMKTPGFQMRHTSNILTADMVSMGQDILGIVNTYYDGFEKVSSDLAQVQLKERDWEVFLDNSGFALKEVEETETDSKINSKIIKVRGTLTDLFDTGLGMNENKHSAWNAYNAVTEFVDHYRSSRKTSAYGSINEARLDSQWFGSGARLKQQAWDAATGLLLVA